MNKVIESGIPNQDERIGVTAEVNNIIGSKPVVVPFEVITNIPPLAKKISWHITKMVGGLEVVYRQDVVGPSMDTLKKRIINKGIIKDGKIVLKKKDGSSIFGSGFTTIGKYCKELVMTWEDEDGNPYNHDWLAENDGTTIGELMEDGYKFQLSMFIKHTPKMGQYKKFVKKIITMISEYDAEPMLAGRTHEIFVGGFKQTADNTELSGVVTPWQPTWLEQNGSVRTTPEFTSLPDENGNMTNQIVVESVGADDKDGETSSIVLNIDSLGKIDSDSKLSEWVGDRPMVRIKYNGPNGQMAVLLPLRKGNGLTSLNNLLLDVWVDSKEIATYMERTDKYEGISQSFVVDILNTLQPLVLELYPSANQVEQGGQLYTYDVITIDQMGKKLSNDWRTSVGLEPMNDMTQEERISITKMEISKDNGRYDIVVNKIWETGGVLTSKTPKWLCEMKNKDFGRNDRNQLFVYSAKDKLVDHIVGVSHNISDSANKAYGVDVDAIRRGERLNGVTIQDELIDLSDMGFDAPHTYRHYLDKVRALHSK